MGKNQSIEKIQKIQNKLSSECILKEDIKNIINSLKNQYQKIIFVANDRNSLLISCIHRQKKTNQLLRISAEPFKPLKTIDIKENSLHPCSQQHILQQFSFVLQNDSYILYQSPTKQIQANQNKNNEASIKQEKNKEQTLNSLNANNKSSYSNGHQKQNIQIFYVQELNENLYFQNLKTLCFTEYSPPYQISQNFHLVTKISFCKKLNEQIDISGIQSIVEKCINLQSLTLQFMKSQIQHIEIQCLNYSLSYCKSLQELNLNLSKNEVGDQGVFQLSLAISQLTKLTTLKLNLKQTQIVETGAQYLANALPNCKELINLNLKINSNNIQSNGVLYLGIAISQCSKIKSLNLNFDSVKVQGEGVKSLGDGIGKLKDIEFLKLKLSYNDIQTLEVKSLFNEISKCSKIKELDLCLKYTNVNGEIPFSKLLKNLTNLEALILNFDIHNFQQQNIENLVLDLNSNKKLKKLELSFTNNKVNEELANKIANNIASISQLTDLKLCLKKNEIKKEVLDIFGIKFSQLNSLKTLKMDFTKNDINSTAFRSFIQNLSQTKSLKQLQINMRQFQIQYFYKNVYWIQQLISQNAPNQFLQDQQLYFLNQMTSLTSLRLNLESFLTFEEDISKLQQELIQLNQLQQLQIHFKLQIFQTQVFLTFIKQINQNLKHISFLKLSNPLFQPHQIQLYKSHSKKGLRYVLSDIII
ncbi:hypothetical protein ABPG74_013222 [Tetrahymena malaccensis]